MSTTLSLVSELERLAEALSSARADTVLASISERIAKGLGVKTDEVAIMAVSARWKHLYFLAPAALKNVGYISLSSNSALAARTARDNRAEIVNNFAAVRHASIFEGVKIGDANANAIQKIISAPIQADGHVVGILQISRKGPSAKMAGPDFTPRSLQMLWRCANTARKINQPHRGGIKIVAPRACNTAFTLRRSAQSRETR
jgi:hypothetical protein